MPELEAFQEWVEESAVSEATTEAQISAYLRTFPGRTIALIEELMEVAVQHQEKK